MWWPLAAVGLCVCGSLLLIRWVVLTPVRTESEGAAHAGEAGPAYEWLFESEAAAAREGAPPEERWERLVAGATEYAARGADEARRFVVAVHDALEARPMEARVRALHAFLASGLDADLGLGFVIGTDGFLSEAPSLRIHFFDLLARHDPAAAKVLAARLLEARPRRAGEWALAFRELARGRSPEAWPELLHARLADLVADPEWSAEAPPGWLEAFDVFAAARSTRHLAALSERASVAKTRAERFAAFRAADQLMLLEPEAVLAELNRDERLFAAASGARASLFARVDPRDDRQLRHLEAWFRRADVLAGERSQFASLFPRHVAGPSHNLLTAVAEPPPEELAARDRAALACVRRWRADPGLDSWRGIFEAIEPRLQARLDR